jgi:N6-adenosine-specific RNA methylase IME4
LNELKEFDIELHENLKRKQFTPMEEAEALMERKAIYERVYPETKQASSEQMKAVRRGVKITARQDSFTESTAKVMDISRSAVEKKLALNALPDKYKEELRQPRAKVSVIMKKMKIEKQKEDIKKIEPAKGIYDVIVMDPPWDFTSGDRNMPDYPRMTQSELEKIKLPASKDCILWLWTIDIKLKEAIELLESWGFERKSTLIWVKQHWGVGNWLRNQHEYCFIAIKGKPLFTGEKESTVLHADKTGHSTKPDEFYKLVERTCYGRKLDYFARKKREGWDVYGDEVA